MREWLRLQKTAPHPNSPAGRNLDWSSLGVPDPNSPAGLNFDYMSSLGIPHPHSHAGRTEHYALATAARGPMDQITANLVRAQDAALHNPAYQPKERTHCNQATWDVAKSAGAPMGPLTDRDGKALPADIMRANLARPDSGYTEVPAAEAQRLANHGLLVIVTGPGHVATVRPDTVGGESIPGTGPALANVARPNHLVRLSRAFKRSAFPEVRFYTPNPRAAR